LNTQWEGRFEWPNSSIFAQRRSRTAKAPLLTFETHPIAAEDSNVIL